MTASTMGVLGALLGASAAGASMTARPWLVALVGATMAFQAVALHPLSVRRPRIGLRLVGLIVGIKALQLVAGRSSGVDAEFAIALAVGVVSWVAGSGTASDVDAIERGIDVADGLTPVQRLRMRVMFLGIGAVIAAGWGVIGLGGLVDLRRPAAARMSPAPLAFFAAAVLALGYASRRSEFRRWERDGARVDPTVSWRWSRLVVVTTALSAAVGLALPLLAPGVTAVPANGVAASGRVGDWVADRMLALGEALDTEADPRGAGEGGAVTAPEFEPVEPTLPWIGDVALWLLLAAIFASVIVRARNRREMVQGESESRMGLRDVLLAIWGEFRDLFATIRRLIARLARRRGRGDSDSDQAEQGGARWGSGAPPWEPSDPIRQRIARAYRQAVGVIAPAHGPVGRSETPRELAGRVGIEPFAAVTGLFEEARYSDHVLTDRQAVAAEQAAGNVEVDGD